MCKRAHTHEFGCNPITTLANSQESHRDVRSNTKYSVLDLNWLNVPHAAAL